MAVQLILKKDGKFKQVSSDVANDYIKNQGWSMSSFIEKEKAEGTYEDSLKRRNEVLTKLSGGNPNTLAAKLVSKSANAEPIAYTPVDYTSRIAYTPVDYTSRINSLMNAKKNSLISGLNRNKISSLNAVDKEKAEIDPAFREEESSASVESALSRKELNEVLAAKGYGDGSNISANISHTNALQNKLGALNRAKTKAYQGIANKRQMVEEGYNSDLARINSEVEAEKLDRLIQAQQNEDEMNYRLSRDAIADNRYEKEWNYNTSPDNPAVEAQMITNQINRLKLQNLPIAQQFELQQLEQGVKNGAITIQEAKYKLEQLTNPDSIYNKQNGLELQRLMQEVEANDINLDILRKDQELL